VSQREKLRFKEQAETTLFPYVFHVTLWRPSHDEQRIQSQVPTKLYLALHFITIDVCPGILDLDAPRYTIALKNPVKIMLGRLPHLSLKSLYRGTIQSKAFPSRSHAEECLGMMTDGF